MEQWYSSAQSRLYFDTDLTKRGLAPVYVAVTNQGSSPARVKVNNIRLIASPLDTPASPVPFDEVVERMRRKAVGPAIVWGALGLATLFFALIFTPMGSAMAISQTASVNDHVKADVWNKSFKDTELAEGQEARGVVFFDIPQEIKKLEKPCLLCPVTFDGQPLPITLEVCLT